MRIRIAHSQVLLIFASVCVSGLCGAATNNIDPTNKHAWAENTGWANFAPTNSGVSVYFNGTSGYLTGYAWGENIGWIKLGHNNGGPYTNNSYVNWGVNLDVTGKLSGYAWGENVGWIKFDPPNSQVTIDKTTGQFDGYAWGENTGWIRFKGSAPNFNVRTWAFDAHPMGTPDWWLALFNVEETSDTDNDHMLAWQEYVTDTDPTNPASFFHIVVISNLPPAAVYFTSSARRYYTLQRRADLQTGSWTNVTAQIDIQGAGGIDSLQDTTATSQQFYRVEVKVSP